MHTRRLPLVMVVCSLVACSEDAVSDSENTNNGPGALGSGSSTAATGGQSPVDNPAASGAGSGNSPVDGSNIGNPPAPSGDQSPAGNPGANGAGGGNSPVDGSNIGNPPAPSGGQSPGGNPSASGADGGNNTPIDGVQSSGVNNAQVMACAPLPLPVGNIVRVTPEQADELSSIVYDAASGTTILLADGLYQSGLSGEGSRRMQFHTAGVTLRSESGNAQAVVIDGQYDTNEIAFVTASDVTIADVTIMRARDHLVHITGSNAGAVTGVALRGLRLIDSGEQFVKVNSNGNGGYADNGSVTCSAFELTDEGRPEIERSVNGCYTGGIDTHSGWGWRVANNSFRGIYCAGEGLAEHAVHFWRGARDTLVENNTIINCARGVGFGLSAGDTARRYDLDPYPGVGDVEHYDGIIRNNVIYADIPYHDTGIELQNAHGAVVIHNTVFSTAGVTDFFSSIDARFEPTNVTIRNNIVRRMTERNSPTTRVGGNLEITDPSIFVDASGGDFHLTAAAIAAIDQGVAVDDSGVDIDGTVRDDGAADIGADERE